MCNIPLRFVKFYFKKMEDSCDNQFNFELIYHLFYGNMREIFKAGMVTFILNIINYGSMHLLFEDS